MLLMTVENGIHLMLLLSFSGTLSPHRACLRLLTWRSVPLTPRRCWRISHRHFTCCYTVLLGGAGGVGGAFGGVFGAGT